MWFVEGGTLDWVAAALAVVEVPAVGDALLEADAPREVEAPEAEPRPCPRSTSRHGDSGLARPGATPQLPYTAASTAVAAARAATRAAPPVTRRSRSC